MLFFTRHMLFHRVLVFAMGAVLCAVCLGPAHPARAMEQTQLSGAAWLDELLPCGPSIASGQTMSCSLSVAAEVDSVTFTTSGNAILLLRAGTTAGDIRPRLRVSNPSAATICDRFSQYTPSVEISRCVLSEGGTYTITIADYSGIRVGNYNLFIQQMNGGGAGAPIAIGASVPGSLATAATADSYSFTVDAGAVALVRAGVSAGTMTPDLRIYAADGVLVCSRFDQYEQGTEANPCVLSQAGSYTLWIADYSGVRNGSYVLYLQQLDAPAGTAELAVGAVQTGSLPSAALADSYALLATANDVVELRLGVTAGTMRPTLRVFSPEGILLCSQTNQYNPGTEIARCVLPQSGTYLVLVTDVSVTRTGSYSLFAQRLRDAVGALPLALGAQTSGTIQSAAQVNSYTIHGQANDVLLIRVARTSGGLNPAAVLFDPDGIAVCGDAEQYGAAVELVRCPLSRSGTYTLFVADTSVVKTGGYGLYAQSVASPAASWLITDLGVFGGILPGAAWGNAYSWLAGQNETLHLRMTITSGTIRPAIRVYDPDGTLVCSASQQYNLTAEIATCLLPRAGLYTFLATDSSGVGNGSYNLSVTCLAQLCGGMLTKTVDSAGGVLRLGVLTITIPPGAFAAPTNLALGLWQGPADSVEPGAVVLHSFRLQADQSGQPLTAAVLPLTLTADGLVAAAEASTRAPYLAQWDAQTQRWKAIDGQVSGGPGTVTAATPAISNIALIMPPAAQHRVYVSIVRR